MTSKTKLELTWPGKDKRPCLEPRILIEDPAKSFAAGGPAGDLLGDADAGAAPVGTTGNMLIKGDNLLALKALEADYAGSVQCIYIDPPFNTGSAFQYYDDGLEHSVWLEMMHQRFLFFKKLLCESGAIAVQLDDTEAAYAKVLMDEVFGRANYITTVSVEAATTSSFKTVNTGPTQVTNFILLFAKNKAYFNYQVPYIGSSEVDLAHFSRFIENPSDPAKTWRFQSINSHVLQLLGYNGQTSHAQWAAAKAALGAEEAQNIVRDRANQFALENAYRVFETKTLQKPSRWLRDHIARSRDISHVLELERDGMEPIYLLGGRQVYFLGKGLRDVDGEQVIARPVSNLWTDIPTNNLQSEGGISFPSGKKPEFLIQRVLQMLSDPGDLVLDSFAGSGTTGAVAQKMGRRWIMVEIGDHADTHIVPRLQKVIDGSDQGGISKAVGWKGGGSFRYYTLAPSLLQRDAWGNLVISKDYDAPLLARAMCGHLGFAYAPSADENEWWRHGQSSETDFLYITTQSLTHDALKLLSDAVGEGRTLMICARAFAGSTDGFANLTCRKIPATILTKCEWGRDDYSLNVPGEAATAPEDTDD